LAGVAGLLTEPPRDETGGRADRSLVVVAHRGPVQFARRNGRTVVERGAGGVVTALRHAARNTESMRWICAATSDEDRAVSARERWSNVPLGDGSCLMHMVDIDPDAHHAFYAVIANPLLWFLQHNLWDHALAPDITTRRVGCLDRGLCRGEQKVRTFAHGYRRRAAAQHGHDPGLPLLSRARDGACDAA